MLVEGWPHERLRRHDARAVLEVGRVVGGGADLDRHGPGEATVADGGDAAPGQYFVAFVPADATVTSVTAFDADHEQIAQATKVPAVELPELPELPALPEPPPVPAKG